MTVKQTAALPVGDALVVFEGAARVKWRRRSASCWTPVGLWPNLDEQAEIAGRLHRREPVLVVLGEREVRVPVTAEELAGSSADLYVIADIHDDHAELPIPQLDWLPAELRHRGERFRDRTDAAIAATPAPLRPRILLEHLDADDPAAHTPVRFARRGGPVGCAEREWPQLLEHAFGAPRHAATAAVR